MQWRQRAPATVQVLGFEGEAGKAQQGLARLGTRTAPPQPLPCGLPLLLAQVNAHITLAPLFAVTC